MKKYEEIFELFPYIWAGSRGELRKIPSPSLLLGSGTWRNSKPSPFI